MVPSSSSPHVAVSKACAQSSAQPFPPEQNTAYDSTQAPSPSSLGAHVTCSNATALAVFPVTFVPVFFDGVAVFAGGFVVAALGAPDAALFAAAPLDELEQAATTHMRAETAIT